MDPPVPHVNSSMDLLAMKERKYSLLLLLMKVHLSLNLLAFVTDNGNSMQYTIILFHAVCLLKSTLKLHGGRAEWMEKGHKCLILWSWIKDWANYMLNFE